MTQIFAIQQYREIIDCVVVAPRATSIQSHELLIARRKAPVSPLIRNPDGFSGLCTKYRKYGGVISSQVFWCHRQYWTIISEAPPSMKLVTVTWNRAVYKSLFEDSIVYKTGSWPFVLVLLCIPLFLTSLFVTIPFLLDLHALHPCHYSICFDISGFHLSRPAFSSLWSSRSCFGILPTVPPHGLLVS